MRKPNVLRWWVLGAMGAILGVILLDETVVAVALPTIQEELGLSSLTAHWVVNIYLLTLAGLAGAAGRLGDIFGARVLLITGLLIFGSASTLGGFAQSGLELILARMIQGIGAALIFPLSIFVVTASFPEKERGLALGLYGAIGTTFLALGPLVGGVLTEYLSWRWIFWINPPVVVAVACITWFCWRDPIYEPEEGFDWLGLVLLVGGLSLLVFGIMEGPESGWSSAFVYGPLVAGSVMLTLFIAAEVRAPTPLIAVGLFANPSFTAFNLIIFTAQFAKMAMFVFGALYFQMNLGVSPVYAGAALLPAVAPQVFIAPYAGKATDRHGPRLPSLLGMSGLTLGMMVLALGALIENLPLLFSGLFVLGIATPYLFVPPQHAVMSTVPPEMQGQAGGIIMSSQLLGGTVGMAVCSTVFLSTNSTTAVFLATAAFSVLVLAYCYLVIKRPTKHHAS